MQWHSFNRFKIELWEISSTALQVSISVSLYRVDVKKTYSNKLQQIATRGKDVFIALIHFSKCKAAWHIQNDCNSILPLFAYLRKEWVHSYVPTEHFAVRLSSYVHDWRRTKYQVMTFVLETGSHHHHGILTILDHTIRTKLAWIHSCASASGC